MANHKRKRPKQDDTPEFASATPAFFTAIIDVIEEAERHHEELVRRENQNLLLDALAAHHD